MNMLLLREGEEGLRIPSSDRRYAHILKVLKKKPGDLIEAGRTDGSLGRAVLESVDSRCIVLSFAPESIAPPPRRLRVLMGFPRPIQAGRILKDLSSLGLASIWFCLSSLGEKSYAESRFFRDRDFQSHLEEGAEQGGNPFVPEVKTFWSLERALEALGEEERPEAWTKICCHPGKDRPRLGEARGLVEPCVLALGSERGWTDDEVACMEGRGFSIYQLGDRILKTETAATAAAALILSNLGYM